MNNVIPISAFQDNYIWLIHNQNLNTAAIVDPGDAEPVINYITECGIQPVAILITHHHPDHVGGVNELACNYNLPVYGPASENIPSITHPLKGGDKIQLTNLETQFEILEVPGHTLGHIAYYGHGLLFIGDTLFMSGCGRLFEGTPQQMHDSLNKIKKLPGNTEIYCGHEYTLSNLMFAREVEPNNKDIEIRIKNCKEKRASQHPTVPGTLSIEILTNPFLRTSEPSVINAAEKYAHRSLDNSVEVFTFIRSWKDNF